VEREHPAVADMAGRFHGSDDNFRSKSCKRRVVAAALGRSYRVAVAFAIMHARPHSLLLGLFMPRSAILVTGGAGYIGSHVARQLGEAGETVVVLDNLVTGFREAVVHGTLVVGNTGDRELVSRVLGEHGIDTVLHFAAHTIVPESVAKPLKYYGNNTCATRNLLECCATQGVRQFIFSSTAAVYGIPSGGVASEDTPPAPINPYGTSKLMSEWMLRDLALATDLRYV